MSDQIDIAAQVAYVVSSYVRNRELTIGELSDLVRDLGKAFTGAVRQESGGSEVQRPSRVDIRRSVSHDGITSFEDGRQYKSLRRHLLARGITPEAYREKWGLPLDYPMIAPGYSARRAELAKQIGLRPKGGRRTANRA
jgi:predicted transcriptional regulator